MKENGDKRKYRNIIENEKREKKELKQNVKKKEKESVNEKRYMKNMNKIRNENKR